MNLWIFISRPKKVTLHIDIYATKLTLSNRIQMFFLFSQEMEWTVEWSGSKRREHGCEFNIFVQHDFHVKRLVESLSFSIKEGSVWW